MKHADCRLGDDVRDTVTGYTGCVVSRTEYLNGCLRIGVQARELKDGKPVDFQIFDVEQLELVKAKNHVMPARRTGGDRPGPAARAR